MDDSRKRPGSPGLAYSTRRRRANDEMNAHRMLGAITAAAVVVVAAVTSSVTHTMLASDIRRSVHERRVVASTGRITAKTSTSAAPTVLGVSTGCLNRPSKKLADTASPASTRPSFSRTLLDVMMSCIHQQYCAERKREREFYRQFCTPRSPIAHSDSKKLCRYHFQRFVCV